MANLEVKRHLGKAMEFYGEILSVLKVKTLEEAKVVLKFVIKEQNVSRTKVMKLKV